MARRRFGWFGVNGALKARERGRTMLAMPETGIGLFT